VEYVPLRRLRGSRGADEDADLPGRDRQRQVVDGSARATRVALRDVAEDDLGRGAHRARLTIAPSRAQFSELRGCRVMTAHKPGLLERLDEGPVICAEGYLFEC